MIEKINNLTVYKTWILHPMEKKTVESCVAVM